MQKKSEAFFFIFINLYYCNAFFYLPSALCSLCLGAGYGKVLCCSIGEFYNSTAFECASCPIGQYNDLTHVTDQLPLSCESCPRNKFAPIAGLPECSDCEEDQYR